MEWRLFGVLALLVIWVFFPFSFVCLLFGVFFCSKKRFLTSLLLCRTLLSTILRSFAEKQSHALKISSSGSPFLSPLKYCMGAGRLGVQKVLKDHLCFIPQ